MCINISLYPRFADAVGDQYEDAGGLRAKMKVAVYPGTLRWFAWPIVREEGRVGQLLRYLGLASRCF